MQPITSATLVRALTQTLVGGDPFRCQMMSGHSETGMAADYESEFLSSRIGDEWSARLKLLRILGPQVDSIQTVFHVGELLKAQWAALADSVMGEVVVYLANAWSKAGAGLFDPAISRNAAIAADLAMAQAVLPRISQAVQALPAWCDQLIQALNPFPRSAALLATPH